jgi:2-polyprenyl-3-methyl-5-hydroxy-6-metoxy-1,4-benzoquinol methylase
MSAEISFTGERLIPRKVDPDLFNKHFARYLYARASCLDKSVLDAGCGIGYGSSYLAHVTRSVVGVDIDPQTMRDACRRYRPANTRCVVGSRHRLPFLSKTFDVVTSFELIKYLPDA